MVFGNIKDVNELRLNDHGSDKTQKKEPIRLSSHNIMIMLYRE